MKQFHSWGGASLCPRLLNLAPSGLLRQALKSDTTGNALGLMSVVASEDFSEVNRNMSGTVSHHHSYFFSGNSVTFT